MNAARPLNVSVAFTTGMARASRTSNPLTHSDWTNATAAVRRPVLWRKLRREVLEFWLRFGRFIIWFEIFAFVAVVRVLRGPALFRRGKRTHEFLRWPSPIRRRCDPVH